MYTNMHQKFLKLLEICKKYIFIRYAIYKIQICDNMKNYESNEQLTLLNFQVYKPKVNTFMT